MYQLIQADFAKTLALAAGCDLVCTSPPYMDARTYGHGVSWDMSDYQRLGDAVFSALKPGGQCILVLDGPVREWRKGFGTERSFVPWKVMLDWAERVGFRVPDRLAFGRTGIPGVYSGRFRNDWEPMLWFVKPGGTPFLDKRVKDVPGKQHPAGEISTGTRTDGTKYVRRSSGRAVEANVRTIGTYWDYGPTGHMLSGSPLLESTGHPARYPYRLAEDLVRVFCTQGGLVCDPFLGSGTTLLAAMTHDRRFVGGDLLTRPSDGKPWIVVAEECLKRHAEKHPEIFMPEF